MFESIVLFENARAPMFINTGERLMVTKEVQFEKTSSPNELSNLQPDRSTSFSELQLLNA